MIDMEWRIGEIFKYNGEWYQCVEGGCCNCCDLLENGMCVSDFSLNGSCFSHQREDKTKVLFKKLEKVDEIYSENGKLFQKYKVYRPVVGINEDELNTIIAIEIKQINEDMGENNGIQPCSELYPEFPKGTASNARHLVQEKKSVSEKLKEYFTQISEEQLEKDFELIKRFNKSGVSVDDFLKSQESVQMKPFDLEAAKAGKPVCTRDGRKARILCFDRLCCDEISTIVACVLSKDGKDENVIIYNSDGFMADKQHPYADDLMMIPEKKEGWAKVRKDINLYDTKEEADRKMIGNDEYVTAKVCWEE